MNATSASQNKTDEVNCTQNCLHFDTGTASKEHQLKTSSKSSHDKTGDHDTDYPEIDPNWLYFHAQVIPSVPQRAINKFKLTKMYVLDATTN